MNKPDIENQADEFFSGKPYQGVSNTNREVVESFRNLIAEKGPISDDTALSKREIYFSLVRYRSYIISEKLRQNNFSISKQTYQTIPAIPLVKVDMSEAPIEESSGCTWMKTKYPVPRTIGPFSSVVSLTGNIKYDYIEWERFEELQHSRFKSEIKQPYYTVKYVKDYAYIYLWNDNHKAYIQVSGIFENPLVVQNYYDPRTGRTNPCFSPLDEEFVLDAELLPRVYELAINQFARIKMRAEDKVGDNSDDLSQGVSKGNPSRQQKSK